MYPQRLKPDTITALTDGLKAVPFKGILVFPQAVKPCPSPGVVPSLSRVSEGFMCFLNLLDGCIPGRFCDSNG